MENGETFLQIQRRLLQHLIRKSQIHGSVIYQDKHQFRIRDASQARQPEIQSSLVREDFTRNCWANQQRLQISDLHFDKLLTPAPFSCWKIRFKTEENICSQLPAEAMLWIKEVEMVGAVDDLKFSCSITGI